MKLKLDRIKAGIPRVRVSPGWGKVLRSLRKVLSMVAITLSILCALLSVSELFVYLIDSSQGVENYVDWTRSLIFPIALSIVFGVLAALLNIERIFKKKARSQPVGERAKLELPDLD